MSNSEYWREKRLSWREPVAGAVLFATLLAGMLLVTTADELWNKAEPGVAGIEQSVPGVRAGFE